VRLRLVDQVVGSQTSDRQQGIWLRLSSAFLENSLHHYELSLKTFLMRMVVILTNEIFDIDFDIISNDRNRHTIGTQHSPDNQCI
jgi:4-hydroxybenzoate polyprenyltransferase